MALKTSKNKYIRLIEGNEINYEVYKSEEERLKVKNATSSDDILNKFEELKSEAYETISKELSDNNKTSIEEIMEFINNNQELKSVYDLYMTLCDEEHHYKYELQCKHGSTYNYVEIKKYIEDISDSIPNIIESGYTLLCEGDIETLYATAKKTKRFGKTKDC